MSGVELPSRDILAQRLEAQREALWDARAIVETTAAALELQFGEDWPADVPEYHLALRVASAAIDESTGALEPDVLLDAVMSGPEQAPPRIVAGAPLPDEVAQKLWDAVADTSDRIAKVIDGIARLTIGGEQSRSELAQVRDLLMQSAEILVRMHAREAERFAEIERLYPEKVWPEDHGEQPGKGQ